MAEVIGAPVDMAQFNSLYATPGWANYADTATQTIAAGVRTKWTNAATSKDETTGLQSRNVRCQRRYDLRDGGRAGDPQQQGAARAARP